VGKGGDGKEGRWERGEVGKRGGGKEGRWERGEKEGNQSIY